MSVPADFAYRRSMMFRAVPMSVLLDGTAPDETVRIVAVDGFRTTLPAPALLATGAAGAYLAIEPTDAPWPPLKAGAPETAGPFYVVWPRSDRAAASREQWPYRIVKIEAVASPGRRFPMTAPAASVPANHPIRTGFAIFQKHCASCHKSVETSTKSTENNEPGVENCQSCHAPSKSRADCAACHYYHPPSLARLIGAL